MSWLFRPSFLACPVCNAGTTTRRSVATAAHHRQPNGRLVGYDCGHEFGIFEALQASCGDLFGIQNAFADWHWSDQVQLVAGQANLIRDVVPSDVKLFAAFVAQRGVPPKIPLLWTRVVQVEGGGIAIWAPAQAGSSADHLGKEFPASISLAGHTVSEFHGWATLLFESLADYFERRFSLAVFKLATALQLAADRTLDQYLASRMVLPGIRKTLLKGTRQWHSRVDALLQLAEGLLAGEELSAFTLAGKQFLNEVRIQRNQFAHDNPTELTLDEASRAFQACFALFWGIERIQDASRGP